MSFFFTFYIIIIFHDESKTSPHSSTYNCDTILFHRKSDLIMTANSHFEPPYCFDLDLIAYINRMIKTRIQQHLIYQNPSSTWKVALILSHMALFGPFWILNWNATENLPASSLRSDNATPTTKCDMVQRVWLSKSWADSIFLSVPHHKSQVIQKHSYWCLQ